MPMPDQPKTVDLPAADPADIRHAELKSLIVMSISALDSKVAQGFARVDQNLAVVANDVTVTKDRLTNVETRVGTLEGRATTTSIRVGQASQVDLSHEAQIAEEIVARQTLGEDVALLKASNVVQLEILQRLDKVFANKAVKVLLAAAALAATAWLASKGVHIGAP